MRPPAPDLNTTALFLDFDGTLAELAARPDAVKVPPALPATLERLSQRLNGALAVVSGRAIEELDHFLRPYVALAAGVHGAERRGSDGILRRMATPGLDVVVSEIRRRTRAYPAVLVEEKPAAVALHYRQAPELEALCLEIMTAASQGAPGMVLLRGKMVFELKPQRASKGLAVRAFLEEDAAFKGRMPVFVGDDVTDEAAFEVVQSLRGMAVKIGEGESLATYRLQDPAELRAWLEQLSRSPLTPQAV